MVGATMGSYHIVRQIGEGGMGTVYLGTHSILGRPAAIKVLLPELSQDRDIVGRFFNEARAATAIRHPGIIEIYDFGYLANGSAYIAMEFLEGETLASRLRGQGRLSVDAAIQITRQIAGALHAAHGKGITHRDLKPDNVFLVPDPEIGERVKLLDFGIAKLATEDTTGTRTRTGMVMGTPVYMSPEQCRGSNTLDSRSDLYSLGCIFYELLAGRPVFDVESANDIIAHHLYFQPEPVRKYDPSVPEPLDQLILSLLSKDPGLRPATAGDVVAILEQWSQWRQWSTSVVVPSVGAGQSGPMLAGNTQPRSNAGGTQARGAGGGTQPRPFGGSSRIAGSTPPQGLGGSTPPRGPGGSTPPQGLGGNTPPHGLGGSTPPHGLGGSTPPHGLGGSTPPHGLGGNTPPRGLGGNTPPPGFVASTPPRGVGGSAPPRAGGGSTPPGQIAMLPTTLSGSAGAVTAPPRPRRVLWFVGVAVLAAAAGVVVIAATRDKPTASAELSPPAQPPRSPPATPPGAPVSSAVPAPVQPPAPGPETPASTASPAPVQPSPTAPSHDDPSRPAATVPAEPSPPAGDGRAVSDRAVAAVAPKSKPAKRPRSSATKRAEPPAVVAAPSESPARSAETVPVTPATTPAPVEPRPAPPSEAAIKVTTPVQPVPVPTSPGSLDAMSSIGSVNVDGPLPSSEIRSNVERQLGAFRDCYRSAARQAGKTPALRITLSFVIDEGRSARSVRVTGDTLGLAACLKDAASKIRTRVAPDVGTATVNVVIRFQPTGG